MSNVKWRDAFEKQRQITEKRNTSRFTKYYQSQYNKGVDNIIATGSTDYTSLFTISFLIDYIMSFMMIHQCILLNGMLELLINI